LASKRQERVLELRAVASLYRLVRTRTDVERTGTFARVSLGPTTGSPRASTAPTCARRRRCCEPERQSRQCSPSGVATEALSRRASE
jgi:hypothetical protein